MTTALAAVALVAAPTTYAWVESSARARIQGEKEAAEAARQQAVEEKARAVAESARAENERQVATAARDAARRDRTLADGRRLVAESMLELERDPALALQLAIAAAERLPPGAADQALFLALGASREVRRLHGPAHPGFAANAEGMIAVSPDGRWIARLGPTSVRIWSGSKGGWQTDLRRLHARWGFHDRTSRPRFSPDGNRLALVDASVLTVWNLDSEAAAPVRVPVDLRELGQAGVYFGTCFAAGGKEVLVPDGRALLRFSTDDGTALEPLRRPYGTDLDQGLFDRAAERAVAAWSHAQGSTVEVWEPLTGRSLTTLEASWPASLSANGTTVLAGKASQPAGLPPGMRQLGAWRVEGGRELAVEAYMVAGWADTALGPEGSTLLAYDRSGQLCVWDLRTPGAPRCALAGAAVVLPRPSLPLPLPIPRILDITTDESLALIDVGGTLKLYDLHSGRLRASHPNPAAGVRSPRLSAWFLGSHRYVHCAYDGPASIASVASWHERRGTIRGLPESPGGSALSSSGTMLAVAAGRQLMLAGLSDDSCRALGGSQPGPIQRLAFVAADQRILVAATRDGEADEDQTSLQLLSTADGNLLAEWRCTRWSIDPQRERCVVVGGEGLRILACSDGRTLHSWPSRRAGGERTHAGDPQLSPDHRHVAFFVRWEFVVRRLEDDRIVWRMRHNGQPTVEFSADGSRLQLDHPGGTAIYETA